MALMNIMAFRGFESLLSDPLREQLCNIADFLCCGKLDDPHFGQCMDDYWDWSADLVLRSPYSDDGQQILYNLGRVVTVAKWDLSGLNIHPAMIWDLCTYLNVPYPEEQVKKFAEERIRQEEIDATTKEDDLARTLRAIDQMAMLAFNASLPILEERQFKAIWAVLIYEERLYSR